MCSGLPATDHKPRLKNPDGNLNASVEDTDEYSRICLPIGHLAKRRRNSRNSDWVSRNPWRTLELGFKPQLSQLVSRAVRRWAEWYHPRMLRQTLLIALGLILSVSGSAQLKDLARQVGAGNRPALSDDRVAAGLKEALQVGAGNAVNLTGKVDGYFKNEAIKILFPPKLQFMEKGLRAAGQGRQVDEFVLSMNRAAEKAAPQARAIFADAIRKMTFDDARKILTGGDTAATEYFKSRTSTTLTAAFKPIVSKATSEVGATQQYKQLMGRAPSIPFLQTQSLDLDDYVVGQALRGLFYMLGEEEKKIRKNPAAQVTSLLKEVFGKR